MKTIVLALTVVLGAGCSKDAASKEQPKPAEATPVEPETPKTQVVTHALSADHATALAASGIATLGGEASSLAAFDGKAVMLVNVASECGLTPQYSKLEELQKKYAARGFSVVGFPCNQFGGQEPGTADEIKTFCSTNYGITFPMMEKIEVNGPGRHPIYAALTTYADAAGAAGDVEWNFEKFLISADRSTITRIRPRTEPDDPAVVAVLEAALPRP